MGQTPISLCLRKVAAFAIGEIDICPYFFSHFQSTFATVTI
jgi:hypothetical protein